MIGAQIFESVELKMLEGRNDEFLEEISPISWTKNFSLFLL